MPSKTTIEPTTWHAIDDGITIPPGNHQRFGPGRVLLRGDEFVVDAEFIEQCRDGYGNSWADDLSDDGQIAHFGRLWFAPGTLESNGTLAAEVAAKAAADAQQLEQERRLQNHRYGKKEN